MIEKFLLELPLELGEGAGSKSIKPESGFSSSTIVLLQMLNKNIDIF